MERVKKDKKHFLCSFILVLFLGTLIAFFASLNYSYRLKKQLLERNNAIEKLATMAVLTDSLFEIKKDSNGMILYFNRNEYGKILSYNDMDSIITMQNKIIQEQDAIILLAKRKYKFNYSIKSNDSIITMRFWEK